MFYLLYSFELVLRLRRLATFTQSLSMLDYMLAAWYSSKTTYKLYGNINFELHEAGMGPNDVLFLENSEQGLYSSHNYFRTRKMDSYMNRIASTLSWQEW